MGTTAQLRAAGLRAGDEVVLPSYGGEQAARALLEIGAVPVFADIDARSFCLDPRSAEAALTPRTTAVMPVHLFGHPADLVGFHELAQRRGLRVLEAGERPPFGALSAEALHRQRCAAHLDERLRGVVVPTVAQGVEHTYEQYVVRVPGNGRPDRDAFKQAMRSRGVACRVPIPTPAHRTPGLRSEIRLPETERAAAESLALPVHAGTSRRDLQRIVAACRALGGLLLEPA